MIARIASHVRVIDLTHGIAPHDVAAGARALARAAPWLDGVALAVVDPGVGTSRRGVAVEARRPPGQPSAVLVGPDNGLLVPAARAMGGIGRVVVLDRPAPEATEGAGGHQRGPTFDGRDVFAPAAARLAAGEDIARLGAPLEPDRLVTLFEEAAVFDADGTGRAHVVWVDRFGNAQLDLPPPPVGSRLVVTVGGRPAFSTTVARAFDDVAADAVGLVVDSEGAVALAARRRAAAGMLGVGPGDVVTVRTAPHGR